MDVMLVHHRLQSHTHTHNPEATIVPSTDSIIDHYIYDSLPCRCNINVSSKIATEITSLYNIHLVDLLFSIKVVKSNESVNTWVRGSSIFPPHISAAVLLFLPTDGVFLTVQKPTALERIRHLHHPEDVKELTICNTYSWFNH